MKILLRETDDGHYEWKTAKYNNEAFYVDGKKVNQTNIVSIVNDNRKNYIQCSHCGQVFRKGDRRFQAHKENAIKPETCFGCRNLCTENKTMVVKKYVVNSDGSFSEKIENKVDLRCSQHFWRSYSITSEDAINLCLKRQCAVATETPIVDFFTEYPGAFDDIITIDSLLDNGYEVGVAEERTLRYDIEVKDEYTIGVTINPLGIVDKFYVWYEGDRYWLHYSRKYDELFYDGHEYFVWDADHIPTEIRNEIKETIAKLYR